jgi:hypothetical protein
MSVRGSALFCALVLITAVIAATAAETDPEIFIFGRGIDKQFEWVWAIKRSRLLAIPSWEPGKGEAPLSPNHAVVIASDYLDKVVGVYGAKPFAIQLITLGNSAETENRWAYYIHFMTDPPMLSDDPRVSDVHVAMDGKVIVPEKRQRTQH